MKIRSKIDKEISQELYEQIYQLGIKDERERVVKEIEQQSKNLRNSMIGKKYSQWNSALKQSADKLNTLIVKIKK